LDKKESLAGQEDLFDQTDDEAGEESDYEEEGEEDEDADMSGQESESLAGSDLESELEEDSDEQIDAADEEARLALAATLGITDVDANGDFDEKGDKEEEEEEDDDDESSMDDEGMMALDETLANIFRERKRMLSESKSKSTKKNEAKEARQNIIQFKLRILDLISIYIKQQPANVLVLSCLRPLLSLINSTKDRQVGEKSHQLVKSLCRSKTLPRVDETGVYLVEILEDIHQQAQKSSNKAHSTACSQASVFVCKILMQKKDGYIDTIGQVYCTSLTAWMKNKSSKVTPQLFFDLVNFISSIHQNKEIPKPKKNE
jgi:DNA polymerase phi